MINAQFLGIFAVFVAFSLQYSLYRHLPLAEKRESRIWNRQAWRKYPLHLGGEAVIISILIAKLFEGIAYQRQLFAGDDFTVISILALLLIVMRLHRYSKSLLH